MITSVLDKFLVVYSLCIAAEFYYTITNYSCSISWFDKESMIMDNIVWTKSTQQQQWQAHTNFKVEQGETKELRVTGQEYQTLLGFGGCFNELGYAALQKLPEDKREEL